jgi:multicomponent Na+:H+ antiporter subunit G
MSIMSGTEWLIIGLAGAGTVFMLISAVGIVRMPGIFARMHAVGKAATLGVSFLLLAAGIFFDAGEVWRMGALIILFFVTAPVATTAMARAAYRCSPGRSRLLKYDDCGNPQYEPLTVQEIVRME